MARRAKDEDRDIDSPTALELRGSGQPYVQLSVQLPAFYVRVLDREAELLSQRRSTLLELLVLRKSGVIKLERAQSAPGYRAEPGERDVMKRFVWHCRPDIKERLDHLRERMGGIPPRSWVILALNEWIGMPSGMADLDGEPTDIKPRKRPPPPPPATRRTPK